jgi:hypothetical protein
MTRFRSIVAILCVALLAWSCLSPGSAHIACLPPSFATLFVALGVSVPVVTTDSALILRDPFLFSISLRAPPLV